MVLEAELAIRDLETVGLRRMSRPDSPPSTTLLRDQARFQWTQRSAPCSFSRSFVYAGCRPAFPDITRFERTPHTSERESFLRNDLHRNPKPKTQMLFLFDRLGILGDFRRIRFSGKISVLGPRGLSSFVAPPCTPRTTADSSELYALQIIRYTF